MPTLFVEADEPLLVFPSVEVAERYLEAIDVRNGVYGRAFGPSGEPFSIAAEGDLVVITPTHAPADPDRLRTLLARSLEAVGEPASDAASLSELVAAAEAFWKERDPMGERFLRPVPWWGCLLVVVGLTGIAAFLWR